MPAKREGGSTINLKRHKGNQLSVSKPILIMFSLAIIFLTLIFIFCKNSTDSKINKDVRDETLFSLADIAGRIDYSIQSRESFDRNDIHRVHFQIEVPENISQEELKAVAQRVVKEAIVREKCHSIAIDFGPYGYVDFAPYGNWIKAGEIPFNDYKNYQFKYVLFPRNRQTE